VTLGRYQVYIKDVTFGSWIIEAENGDKARPLLTHDSRTEIRRGTRALRVTTDISK
jgi:hypothetical protein